MSEKSSVCALQHLYFRYTPIHLNTHLVFIQVVHFVFALREFYEFISLRFKPHIFSSLCFCYLMDILHATANAMRQWAERAVQQVVPLLADSLNSSSVLAAIATAITTATTTSAIANS